MGYDGADYINGASIRARIDNTPSVGTDMPTRLEFLTTPDNDATPQIRMTIKETGNVGINFVTPNSTLHVEGSFSTAVRIAPTSNPPVNPSGPATPADVTIGKNDHTVVFNPSTVGYNSVTLPNASSCGGRIYYLLNRSGFTINSVDQYNTYGGNSNSLPPNTSTILQAINGQWYLIDQ